MYKYQLRNIPGSIISNNIEDFPQGTDLNEKSTI